MRILVTNDDGIHGPGLVPLTRALLDAGHEVDVAVPATDRSGTGSGIGSIEHGTEVGYAEQEMPGLPGVSARVFDAPPSFGVLASCSGVLGPRPELVVSGINDGFNTGRFLLASSTVGAALAAGSLGARALAISAGFAPAHRFDTAARVAVETVRWMIDHSRPRTVLNVNVPNLDVEQLKGVRLAELAPRGLMGLRIQRTESSLRLERYENTEGLGVDTDAALIREGYVSVSVLPSISQVRGVDPGTVEPAAAVEQALRAHPLDRAVAY